MKEFLKRTWKVVKVIPIIIFRDFLAGLIGLFVGTAVIFFMGLSLWFLSGYKGVQNYFDALTGKKE